MKHTWEVKTKISSNSLLWGQLVLTAVLSSGFVFILLLTLNLVEGHWEEIPSSFAVWGILSGSFFVVFALVFMLISRGITTVYTITDTGIQQKTITKYGKWAKWLSYIALFFGGLRGAQAAVSVNMARAREDISLKWDDISEAIFLPEKYEIHVKNNWRVLIQLVCLPENFEKIKETVVSKVVKKNEPHKKTSGFAVFFYTFITLLFGALLFPRLPIHFVGIFTILLMVFTLFAIWAKGTLKKVTASISLAVIAAGLILAYFKGTNNFHSEGFLYALVIQSGFLTFFFLLNLKCLVTGKTSAD